MVWSVAYAQSQLKEVKSDVQPKLSMQSLPNAEIHKDRRQSTTHPIRTSKTISEDTIRRFLEFQTAKGIKGSPLASSAKQISDSPYSSTIIAICWIEQYHCVSAPNFNYWGLGPGIRYKSQEAGIDAINAFLAKAEANGRTTIESFRGFYCQSACVNWESTVISIKEKLDNLE